MNFRMASRSDVQKLAVARWMFRTEDSNEIPIQTEQEFVRRYTAFVTEALNTQRLIYWIAETNEGELVAQMAVFIVQAIPRPSRLQDQWGYLTDCYTHPQFRNRGVGKELLDHVAAWAQDGDLELLLVWPNDLSHSFYGRAGFHSSDELRVLQLREYDAPSPPANSRPDPLETR